MQHGAQAYPTDEQLAAQIGATGQQDLAQRFGELTLQLADANAAANVFRAQVVSLRSQLDEALTKLAGPADAGPAQPPADQAQEQTETKVIMHPVAGTEAPPA